MNAISLIAIVASAQGTISPEEAAKCAMSFFKIVGVQQPYSVAVCRYDDNYYKQAIGVPAYVISLRRGGSKVLVSAVVDSSNGEVVNAYDSLYRKGEQLGDRSVTDKWMSKLGYSSSTTTPGHYTARIGSYRFFNLNGYTAATWMTNKSHFAFYVGYGAIPGLPSGRPSVSATEAKRLAVAQRLKTKQSWPEKLEARPELGLFYDEKIAKTIWVWKVVEGTVSASGFHEVYTEYLDGTTGKPADDQYIQNSIYPYHSRRPSPLFAKNKSATLDSNLYKEAKARLADLGRSDVTFQNIEMQSGIRMSSVLGTMLEVGPTGQLITFKAPTSPGMLGFTTARSKGEALIIKLHPGLPEGKFRVERSRMGNFAAVIYGQKALGYDYLESEVVSVHYNKSGTIARFHTYPPKPKPAGLPAKMMPAKQMESMAYSLVAPRIPKSTPKVRFYASVKAGNIGWFYVPKLKQTRLCRCMSIWMMRDIKGYAVQGGGTVYKMDVETGTIYGYP